MQPGVKGARLVPQAGEELVAPRGRPQEPDVGHGAGGEDAQVSQVGGEVVTHDDRGLEALEA